MNFQSLMNGCQSPVDKDFIWVVEYEDGTLLHEYDLKTKVKNNLSDIKQDNVVRFGLIGRGMKFYYEKSSGIFKLAGQMVEASLKTTNYEFYLTGRIDNSNIVYSTKSRTITSSGVEKEQIYEYNFGYETDLNINGFKISFKVLCVIEYGQPIKLVFEAINDPETDGHVRIRKNGEIVEESYMILSANKINVYSWQLK